MPKDIKCSFGVDIDAVAGWLGSYGGGLGVLRSPWDSLSAAVLALIFYFIAVRAGQWYTSSQSWSRTIGAELKGADAGPPEDEEGEGAASKRPVVS